MLVRQGRSIFQNPANFAGSIYGESGNALKPGAIRNRFVGGFSHRFGAYTNGTLSPSSFLLPLKSGSISSYNNSNSEISGLSNLIPGRNMTADAATQIILSDAQLDQVVSLQANSQMTITDTNSTLAGAASASGSAATQIVLSNALCGAIFSVTATSACELTLTTGLLTARAFMIAEAGGESPLSPESLASAVWDTIISEHTDAGTTGAALADAGGTGNPWSALLADNNDPNTFGERVQKLLTTSKFLGLK
jgi:hypothetical protein